MQCWLHKASSWAYWFLAQLDFQKVLCSFKWMCLRIGYTQIQWLIVIFTIKTILGCPSILDKLEWLRLLIHSGVLPDAADFSCVWSEVKFSPHGCSCCQAWLVSAQPVRIHDYFRLKERSPLLRTDVNDDNRPIASIAVCNIWMFFEFQPAQTSSGALGIPWSPAVGQRSCLALLEPHWSFGSPVTDVLCFDGI